MDEGETIYTGRNVQWSASAYAGIDAPDLICIMVDNAVQGGNEAAEGWLEDLPKPAETDLQQRLEKAIDAWADAHDVQPRFCEVADVQEHEHPGEADFENSSERE